MLRSKKKKPRKVDGKIVKSRKTLVRELDREVSLFIRERDGRCVVCGSTENATNGHLFSRASYSTRWDTTPDGNCHQQCLGCNLKHEYDPWPYLKWYINKFGQDKLDEINRRSHAVCKYLDWQLQELLDEVIAKRKAAAEERA